VEALEYAQAHWLAGAMALFAFLVLLAVYTFNRNRMIAGMRYGA
jgi:molybdate transport system permease protein